MSTSTFHIDTPRLSLSLLSASNDTHCDFTVSLIHSPSSTKYNPSGPSLIPDREAARSFLVKSTEYFLRTGYSRYLVSLKPTSAPLVDDDAAFSTEGRHLIGIVSMKLAREPDVLGPLIPDVGFNFLPQFHGKGYATEAAVGLMQWYREEKGIKAFAGLTDEGNLEAKGVFRKLGFRGWGVRKVNGVIPGGPMDVSVWTIGVDGLEELERLRL
jgi:RimJ/RimL family protein N-acetyltransferase